MRTSAQQELAYRANFWISLLHALLNQGVGVLGMQVLFGQVQSVRGWDYPSALALLGVYLVISALRGLFIGPGLEALAGMGQEISSGQFDFALLRPVNTQFLVTFRYWHLFALIDLALGLGVVGAAVMALPPTGTALHGLGFLLALGVALAVLYSVLLALTALVFWSPGFLFTWVFDAIFQLARYPVGFYPSGLRFVLTWILPVGVMTTLPAQALRGQVSPAALAGSLGLAAALLVGSSWLFRRGLRRYASASS